MMKSNPVMFPARACRNCYHLGQGAVTARGTDTDDVRAVYFCIKYLLCFGIRQEAMQQFGITSLLHKDLELAPIEAGSSDVYCKSWRAKSS